MEQVVKRRAGRLRRVVAGCAVALVLAGCSAQYRNHGYVPPSEDLDEIVLGIDTLDSVRETLGSAASGSVLNEDALFYVRSRVRTLAMLEPEVIEREVVAISFDADGVVKNVERFGLERGQVVPISRRVTSSGVADVPFLQQLLGNIGSFGPTAGRL